jgi:hypothetical protein
MKFNLEGASISKKEAYVAGFPVLTPEALKEIEKLSAGLNEVLAFRIPEFQAYTGNGQDVGQGSIYNSPVTAAQLEYALAMTNAPLLAGMIRSPLGRKGFEIKRLIDEQIMSGMKLLDLGSGPVPVFARCCRYMGADVWTVDKEAVTSHYEEIFFPKEQQQIEHDRHIQVNLAEPFAVRVIQERTHGGFNLVTEANLDADGFRKTGEMAMELLTSGGVYFHPPFAAPILKQ